MLKVEDSFRLGSGLHIRSLAKASAANDDLTEHSFA